MPSDLHEILIDQLERRYADVMRMERKRFVHRLTNAVASASDGVDDPAGVRDELGGFNRQPDAFLIDPENRLVILFEVEVSSPLRGPVLRDYAELWFDMDCFDWDVWLIAVDRRGVEREVDLGEWWHSFMDREVAKLPPRTPTPADIEWAMQIRNHFSGVA